MMRKLSVRRLAIRFGFLVMLLVAGLFVIRSSSDAPSFPAEGGAKTFAACPESPNCVSTQAASLDHQMKPVPWAGSSKEALELIQRAVDDQFSRCRIVAERHDYLRYEFTSFVFRFVDDVEFLIDQDTKLIHFRSASRVGHSDLGANRRRMARFREAFERLR